MNDKDFMQMALEEAKIAYSKGEVPIGAVIVKDDSVISRAHNTRHNTKQAINHAEIIAISKACEKLDTWRLEDCKIYITIEPCPMCAGAIIQSRIGEVIYGAYEPKSGVHKSITNLFDLNFNHKVEVKSGILEKECSKLIREFFLKIRKN